MERKAEKIKALTGMHDFLPEQTPAWQALEGAIREISRLYGYEEIRTPLLEATGLFVRSIGEQTDVVGKEMYTFDDNGESVSLRPEGTASCLRAAVEANMLREGPRKLYYVGPMFRHERPQKGRYRQFSQYGVEALGFEGPDVDAEVVAMNRALFRKVGIQDGELRLEINCLGNRAEREAFRSTLVSYLKSRESILDEDSRRRMLTNPWRVLDTKNPDLQEMCDAAPRLVDSLGPESRAHYAGFKALLAEMGIAYVENPRLVRGLDYYDLTVFEWVTEELGSQSTVLGGGRYNGLVGELGGRDAAGVGFALGMDRLMLLLEKKGLNARRLAPDVYFAWLCPEALGGAMRLAEALRRQGLSALVHAGGGKAKTQFQKADKSGALFAVALGPDEMASGKATLKDLRGDKGQIEVAQDGLAQAIEQWKS